MMNRSFSDGRARFSGSIEGSPEARLRELKQKVATLEKSALGGGGIGGLSWAGLETEGVDQNRNTSSSYTTQIMTLRVIDPIRLLGFLWDVRNSGDYALRLLWSANIANSWREIWAETVSASGEITMTLNAAEVLLPGVYYFGLTRTSGSTTWSDYDAASYMPTDPAWRMEGITYNTTSFDFVPGAKLLYQRGIWA